MARETISSIDISDAPELLRLAEEVRRSGKPRVLRHRAEELALLTPLRRRAKGAGQPTAEQTRQALLASAGSWRDVDIDAFLAENRRSREQQTRPPVEL
jgi:hypothetical protein